MKLSTALAMNFLFVGAASASGAASALASAPPSPCEYRALIYGPAIELSPSSQITLSRNETLLSIDDGDSYAVYDLSKSPPEQTSVEADKADDLPVALRSNLDGKPAPISVLNSQETARPASLYGQMERLRSVHQFRRLSSGRVLSIRRLYANVSFLTVSPSDGEQYDQLGRSLLNGNYCGVPFENISPEQKQAIEPIAKFFIWNSFSSGILDNYDSWPVYKHLAETFLSKEELADLLEDYAYRAAELTRNDPILSKIDPDKVWSFAWNAVEELFHDKEFVKFTDLSAYQRNGQIAFMLLGTDPIIGGQLNKFGFYTKSLAAVQAANLHASRAFGWSWKQEDVRYSAEVALLAPQNKPSARQSAFPPDGRNGLIVLDATFAPEDIEGVVNEYMIALKSEGFEFAEQKAISDLPRYIAQRFRAAPRIDYLVREGHADGDDDNVMTVYGKGFVVDGKKAHDGVVENISILFGESTDTQEKRISEPQFRALVNEWHRNSHKPFVYLNTSCWGIEKAWFDLGNLSAEKFMEIASRAPVNYFSAIHADAVHIILDGIRHAESFQAVRSKLASIESYASGYEDSFIFPDEAAYPAPFALLHRSLFVRKRGGKIAPYIPNGYF